MYCDRGSLEGASKRDGRCMLAMSSVLKPPCVTLEWRARVSLNAKVRRWRTIHASAGLEISSQTTVNFGIVIMQERGRLHTLN